MTEITVESRATDPRIRLQSDALTVTVTPGKGSDITSIIHRTAGPLNARLHAGLKRKPMQRRSGDAITASTSGASPQRRGIPW